VAQIGDRLGRALGGDDVVAARRGAPDVAECEQALGEASTAYSTTSWNASGSGSPSTWNPPASVRSSLTVMRFCVTVPVLSEHSTVAAPSISMAGMRRVRTLDFEMRHAPRARNTVRTTGNSSGSMAIASVMPASAASSQSLRVNP